MGTSTFEKLQIGQHFRFPDFRDVLKKVDLDSYEFESGNRFGGVKPQRVCIPLAAYVPAEPAR